MKVYLVVWTADAVAIPQYSVEKAFKEKEDAERYINKNPCPDGNCGGWEIINMEVE